MKKLITLTVILFLFIIQSKSYPGILISSYRGAIDSTHSSIIQIYKYQDTFYAYRQIVSRISSDTMGVKCISSACGIWSKIAPRKVELAVPTHTDTITIIPLMANVSNHDLGQGISSFCCDCANRNQCCMAYTFDKDYFCTNCESNNPCHNTCIVVYDDGVIKIKGSMYIFTYSGLTANNLKIIDVQ